MKTFIVGDIHGRCAQLLNLLDLIPRDPTTDTLVFLGDLIDRGADAPGCVNHIMHMCRENPERGDENKAALLRVMLAPGIRYGRH